MLASRINPARADVRSMLGESEMADRVRALDWAATPLGPIEKWPQALLIAAGICLNSRFPMFVWWGPQLINIYNDGYVPMLGARHPAALGRPARASWEDIWSQVGPQADLVMREARATWNERVHLRMQRHGFPEDTWFTWSYSPIRDESGGVGGLFCAVTEDTARVLVERERDRLAGEQRRAQARDRFLVGIDDATRALDDPNEIILANATLLGRHLEADRCAYAEVEVDEDTMNLTGNYRRTDEVKSIVGRLRFRDFGDEVLQLMRDNQPYVVEDVETHQPPVGALDAYRAAQIRAVICVPLHKHGKFVAAMAVHCMQPRQWLPEEVELVLLVANRCWESLERARMARSLKESESRFRALISATSEVVYRMSPDWGEMRHLQGRDFIGDTTEASRTWLERYIVPEDRDAVREAIARAVRERCMFQLEHRVRRPDGSIGWTQSRAVPIFDERGDIAEWFGAASDVTARRNAEETLKASEAALKETGQRKDEFLAMLAHELRNPLAPISNALQTMRLSRNGETTRFAQDVMERQLRQMVRLVDDLLDVSRITRGKVELQKGVVSLADVIGNAVETVRPLIRARRQSIRSSVPQDVWLYADRARLGQVFANILSNSVKFTRQSGSIEIAAERAPGWICIEIRDNGIGIPRDQLGSIFELFAQVDQSLERSQGGLGIGLTVVKTLVEMHGGSVEAHSDGLGHGSTFRVRLPTREAAASVEGAEPAQPAAPAPLRLLVVDDNRDSARTLGMMLELFGHEVHLEYDGAAALESLRGFRPDAAFLDIGMPGMNGFELCRRIKADPATRQIVVVAQTGWGDAAQRSRSQEAGFDHHLVKPLDTSTLTTLLAAISKQRRDATPQAL